MAFGDIFRAVCQQKVSKRCASLNDEIAIIYNKSRMACLFCNEEIKKGKREERKEQGQKARKISTQLLSTIGVGASPGSKLSYLDGLFYRRFWDSMANWKGACLCEECALYGITNVLFPYWAGYVSHIISRGAETRLRHDMRNANILCYEHHRQWETGDKKAMLIYPANEKIILELKQSLIK